MAVQLLGEIYLQEGKNREALQTFLPRLPHEAGGGLNVDVAITYCRLRDYQRAKRFFSDAAMQRIFENTAPEDLPGTRSLATLEASALLTRGINAKAETRIKDAVADFIAAERLVPRNPLAAYLAGQFISDLGDPKGAVPHYQVAAATGRGELRSLARKRLLGLSHWFQQHPSP